MFTSNFIQSESEKNPSQNRKNFFEGLSPVEIVKGTVCEEGLYTQGCCISQLGLPNKTPQTGRFYNSHLCSHSPGA